MLHRKSTAVFGLLLGLLVVSGCSNFGAQQIPADQFDYNKAIARSMQEQMLLNIVRLRYFEAPVFLAVSSVLTQYAWQGNLGITGQQGFNIGGGLQAPSFIGGSASAIYSERPTVTFLPIEGDDFSRRLMTPIPLDFVFALSEAGYPTDLLYRTGISRMNDVQNMAAGVPAPGDVERELQAKLEIENLKRFQNLINVILKLQLYGAIEVQRREENEQKQRVLVITGQRAPELAALVDEFRAILNLDPALDVFRITDRRMGRAADEITVQTRSILQIMSFLAKGVDVPPEQWRQARFVSGPGPGVDADDGTRVPFRVRWTAERPSDTFVATEYNGYWFSVANTDIESKRAFNLVIYLFRLLAPERAASAPMLTLPSGP
jgi:hypothetical protein